MKFFSWIFQHVCGCHHNQMSRVFTIKKRSYQVCFECGREFENSRELMEAQPAEVPHGVQSPLLGIARAKVSVN
jgi:hypothetical protein